MLREGYVHAEANRQEPALAKYNAAFEAAPGWVYSHYPRAVGLHVLGRLEDAEREYSLLLKRVSNVPELYKIRAKLREDLHDYRGAVADYETGLRIAPDNKVLHNNFGWLLAACADDQIRDGKLALEHAQRSMGLMPSTKWVELALQAAAYAELGQFEEAARLQAASLANATPENKKLAQDRLNLYRESKPYRRPGPAEKSAP